MDEHAAAGAQQAAATTARGARSKNDDLRIPVRGTNRKYYLVPPRPADGRPDYYVRFDVPRDIRALDPRLPKTILRSTGTNQRRSALDRGRAIIESILERRWEDAQKLKLCGSAYSTLDELLTAYKPDAQTIKPTTAANNRRAIEMIVREVLGRPNVRDASLDVVLSATTLRKWIQLRQAKVASRDYLEQGSAAMTINSTLAQARSVVSPKVMELYHDLRLPDVTEFRAVRKVRADADVSYKPLPQTTVNAIGADALLLKRGESAIASAAGVTPEEQPQVYRAYLLIGRMGLRNSEAQFAREYWIARREDGADLELKRRPDFVTKNKRYRTLDIAPDVLAELDAQRGVPDAWIVNGATATDRYNLTHDKLNAWLRHFIPGREKCAYELRKHAISIIVSRPESEGGGIVAAARFAGDSIETTEKHYASYLRKVRAISPAEMQALRVVA